MRTHTWLTIIALLSAASLADTQTVDGSGWGWTAVGPPAAVPEGSSFSVAVRFAPPPALRVAISGVEARGRLFVVEDFSAPLPLPDGGYELTVQLRPEIGPGLSGVALDVGFKTASGSGTAMVSAEVRIGPAATDSVAAQGHAEVEVKGLRWKVRPPAQATTGEPAAFVFDVDIEEGYHIYSVVPAEFSVPTEFTLPATHGRVLSITESVPKEDPDFGVSKHVGKARFQVMVELAAGLEGNQELPFELAWQLCTEMICDQRTTVQLAPTTFVVQGAAPTPAAAPSARLSASIGHTHWQLDAPDEVEAGGVVEIELGVQIDEPYHIYATSGAGYNEPTSFAIDPLIGRILEVRESTPRQNDEPGEDFDYAYHEGNASFTLRVRLANDLAGTIALPVTATFQPCTDIQCDPPEDAEMRAVFAVVEPAPAPEPEGIAGAHGRSLWKLTGASNGEAGRSVRVEVEVAIDQGWHIYGLDEQDYVPTRFRLPASFGSLRASALTPPERKDNELGSYLSHEGTARFALDITLARELSGPVTLPLAVEYQLCDDSRCLLKKTVDLPHALDVAAATGPAPLPPQPVEPPPSDTAQIGAAPDGEPMEADPWGFFLRVIGYALITLVMPCTYPMIPITISVFTKGEAGRGTAIARAAVYGLGIIVAYTGVAGIVQVALGAAGQQTLTRFATNGWVNLAIGAAFLYFAFSFFGYYDIRLPGFLQNLMNKFGSSGSVSYAGVFTLGLFFMLASYSCGAPLVLNVFAEALLLEGWQNVSVLLGFFVFSVVLALPFFLLALLPTILKGMKRAGGWMNTFKVVLGFFEAAFALKFLSVMDLQWELGILTRPMFLGLWIAILLLVAMYLLGMFRLGHDSAVETVSMGRLVMVFLCIAGAIYLGQWFLGVPLQEDVESFLPPHPYPTHTVRAGSGGEGTGTVSLGQLPYDQILDYNHTWAAGEQQARASGTPHLLIFTGHNCINCRKMEAGVLRAPAVVDALGGFTRTVLHTDKEDDPEEMFNQNLMIERFEGTASIPAYYVLDSEGNVLGKRFGAMPEEEFLALLAKAP